MRGCSIFFLKTKILISSMMESPDGDIQWALPFMVMKRDSSATDIGAEVIKNLTAPLMGKTSPIEILKETGFKTWDDFTKAASLLSAEIKDNIISIQPYFSGIDGEFYAVLNREKTSGMEPYELGHVMIKSLEYCK